MAARSGSRLVIRGAPLLLLASAGCTRDAPDPGAITSDEAQALNDAAAMLDANSVSAEADAADQENGQ